MEQKSPVCLGQDKLLPTQNLQPDAKNLQFNALRNARIMALQLWRLANCPSYVLDLEYWDRLALIVSAQRDAIRAGREKTASPDRAA